MSKEKKSLFWASYADLMTSLFFVMLVLFIICIVKVGGMNGELRTLYKEAIADKQEYENILVIPVNFAVDQYNINGLPASTREELENAGKSLKAFVDSTTKKFPGVQYILIIEGQASKTGGTDHNYELSYRRAYSLKKYWEQKDILFDAVNCEVLIGGSGDGVQSGTGLMREDSSKEYLNQRFLIHILPKPGYVKSDDVEPSDPTSTK